MIVPALLSLKKNGDLMLFNSIQYFLFLLIVFILFNVAPHKYRWILILVASYIFYMVWNPLYALLIAFVTFTAYIFAIFIYKENKPDKRKYYLISSLLINLSLLFVFKYWAFFNNSIYSVLNYFDISYNKPILNILLPVGISFYIFQAISYTVDIYRKNTKLENNFFKMALYLSYFPHLVAGPIVRSSTLIPQLSFSKKFNPEYFYSGMQMILWGLFKKVIIADNLSSYVDAVFNNATHHNGTTFLIATYAFAFQIYCDFSGYTDIAIGTSRLFGVELPLNFRQPYYSLSVTEFWRRWHISLSSWLRDYLYISLGGNRKGITRTQINLLLTMVLGGLWHGAAYTFIIWGGAQGIFLIIDKLIAPIRERIISVNAMFKIIFSSLFVIITFHQICFSWIFFRANSISDAIHIIRSIFTNPGPIFDQTSFLIPGICGLSVLLFVEFFQNCGFFNKQTLDRVSLPVRWAAWIVLIFSIILLGNINGTQFIYFQF
jgi:D-alanyl-lipoteichoic acid acyltransferase DltB (MBOAT superfamily)